MLYEAILYSKYWSTSPSQPKSLPLATITKIINSQGRSQHLSDCTVWKESRDYSPLRHIHPASHSNGTGTNHLAFLHGSQSSDSDSYNNLTVIARLLPLGHSLLFIRPQRAGYHWNFFFHLSAFSFGGSQRPFQKANRGERLSAGELE